MIKSVTWWEGAKNAAGMIGQAVEGELLGVCENIRQAMKVGDHPADYKAGSLAAVEMALNPPK